MKAPFFLPMAFEDTRNFDLEDRLFFYSKFFFSQSYFLIDQINHYFKQIY